MLKKGILLSSKLTFTTVCIECKSIFSMNHFKLQFIFNAFIIPINIIQCKNLLLLYSIQYLNLSLYCPRSDEGCERKGQHFLNYTDNSV